MSKLKKYLLPGVLTLCLILGMLSGCAPAATDSQQEISSPSLGEIFDPSGNPLAHRFSDEKDIRTATFVVAASNSVHRYDVDYRCSGANDHVQIQAALNRLPATGGYIFFLDGTYNLGAQVLRAIDDVKFIGCGNATLLNLDGATPVITAGAQDGWLFKDFATDAGGPNIAGATQSAIRSVWIAGVRTDDPVAVPGGDAVITVAADNTPATQKARADFVCSGANDEVTIEALVAAGVTVKLMVGDYVFNATLDIVVSNFTLEGSGMGTVIGGILAVPYIKVGDNSTYIENVTIRDLRIDGTNQTADAGIHFDGGSDANRIENCEILNCTIENCDDEGILADFAFNCLFDSNLITGCTDGMSFNNSDHDVISNNIAHTNTRYGIQLSLPCIGCVIEGNNCHHNTSTNIDIRSSNYTVIVGNNCEDSDTNAGIFVRDSVGVIIDGNTCHENASAGIDCLLGSDYVIVGNTCTANYNGIDLNSTTSSTISGNACTLQDHYGLYIKLSSATLISSNVCHSSSQNLDNTDSNIFLTESDYNLIEANICRMGVLANQPDYGIELDADCDHNIVRDNDLYDSGLTGPINDLGTDTEFNNITFQFIQGTTFISATGSAKGWEIDLAAEWAIALGQLPLELTQVMKIKIWAVGLAAPGAGNGMLIDVNMNAGQDDEAYTAEAIAIVAKINTTDNFGVGDIIHWVLTSADDADIGDLAGGDSFEVQVLFKAAVNGDIDTDAVFRVVEIEYVT